VGLQPLTSITRQRLYFGRVVQDMSSAAVTATFGLEPGELAAI
jgi:hypothetical protein